MENIITVDVNTEREHTVLIKKPETIKKPGTTEEAKEMVIDDMATLCEGIVTLIHLAHQNGMKDGADSIRDCIKHLQDGFIDGKIKTINLAAPTKEADNEKDKNGGHE